MEFVPDPYGILPPSFVAAHSVDLTADTNKRRQKHYPPYKMIGKENTLESLICPKL